MDIKVGDLVDYHSVIGGPVTSSGHRVVQIIDTPNNFGHAVAFVSNKIGCVAVSALSASSIVDDGTVADEEAGLPDVCQEEGGEDEKICPHCETDYIGEECPNCTDD
jgi:hypothetical protein